MPTIMSKTSVGWTASLTPTNSSQSVFKSRMLYIWQKQILYMWAWSCLGGQTSWGQQSWGQMFGVSGHMSWVKYVEVKHLKMSSSFGSNLARSKFVFCILWEIVPYPQCFCPFTVPKMFWAGPSFLCQTKNLFTYCGSHKHFVPDKKMICIQ